MRRGVKALGAFIVLLALLAGIPTLLGATIGDPLAGWSDLKVGDLTNEVVIDLLAAVVWIAWAQFALSVIVEAIAALRHVPHPGHIPLVPGLSQQLAHTLIGSVLLIGTATIALASPVQAFGSPLAHTPVAVSSVQLDTAQAKPKTPHPVAPAAAVAQRHTRQQARTTTYVVPHDGTGPDTYWDIAATHCGGGENWTQIWDLNRGRAQRDGTVMNDPGLLKPGWTVQLPAALAPPALVSAAHVDAVTVHPNDTLSTITREQGLPDWHQAWEASKNMAEPDGQTFTDPNLIRPGWTVKIPTQAATSTPTPTTAPATPSAPTNPTTPTVPNSSPTSAPPPFVPSASATPRVTAAPSATASPAHQEPTPTRQTAASASRSSDLPMVAFTGGGMLLAGVSLAAMTCYRRRQFRWRGAGRAIGATPPELHRIERHLLASGGAGITDVTWLDQALRSLVHTLAEHEDARLPDVVAARMTPDVLELVLATARPDAPAPWAADETATRWSVKRGDSLSYDPADRAYHFAPFPTLASVGYTDTGEHWLLDLERVAAMSVSGDPERCLNLARFLAAELSHNTWSEMLRVTLVGFGREMADINPDRLTYTEDFGKAIASLHHQLDSVHDAIGGIGVDVLTGRLHDVVGDAWAPHVLLIAPHLAEDTNGLDELLQAMRAQPSRAAVALVLADNPDHADGTRWQLRIDEHGILRIPALDIELIAQQIPAAEAADLTKLLALAARTEDRPVPPARGDKPWDAYADAIGGLRQDLVTPAADEDDALERATRGRVVAGEVAGIPELHPGDASPRGTNSVLPLSKRTYRARTAATEDDVDALGPQVTEEIRRRIKSADPHLDADLADWRDPACTRPKVTLLGPVSVTAQGPLPERSPRRSWNTEVVAYLVTRPNGALSERLGAELWPAKPTSPARPRSGKPSPLCASG